MKNEYLIRKMREEVIKHKLKRGQVTYAVVWFAQQYNISESTAWRIYKKAKS
jgi:hypothetical protein